MEKTSATRRAFAASLAFLGKSVDVLGSGLDRLAFALSPNWGTRRKASRVLAKLGEAGVRRFRDRHRGTRKFSALDGADHDRHRGQSWLASKLSPDSALEEDLITTRERANELALTNPWAANYHHGLASYVVGSGRRPQAKIQPIEGRLTKEQAARHNHELEDLFARWACCCGANGESLAEIQLRLCYNRSVDGDAFLVLSDVGAADKPIPLTLNVIAADRVETPPQKAADKRVRHGIERDDNGRVLAVWIRNSRPNDNLDTDERHTRVPVYDGSGRRRVLHFKRHTWEGASRGLPDTYPAMNDLKDLDDVWEAEGIRKYIQACMAGFISTPFDPDDVAAATAAEVNHDGQRLEDISPGMLEYLRPGEEVTFSSPQGDDNLDAFMSWRLRSIAAALQFPFELLVKKWENSYSGGRLALIDGHQRFKRDAELLDCQVLRHVWSQFVLEALLVGELTVDEKLYGEMPDHFVRCKWLGDPLPWIDPENEVEAAAKSVALGLDTMTGVLGSRGIDFEDYIETRHAELEALEDAGLPQLIPAGWAERLTAEQLAEAAQGTVSEPGTSDATDDSKTPAGAA